MNEIRLLFDRAVHSAEDRRYEAALLGALDGSSLSVPGRTGYVYARRGPNGELGEIIARNTKVSAAYGLPVKMRLEAGQWVIREAEGQFSDPDVDPGESGVYPHASTHQHGGSDEVATATPGANAVIKADADGKIGAGWIDDADIDHGSIGGLADDDHTQYHNDTRGDLRYAPIAKGVTNGDSHDHSGGDGAQIDHGGLAGLSDDDHAQYALLAGRSGGQTLTGGTASGDDLMLSSSSHGTKGNIGLGSASAYDEVNDRLGVGITASLAKVHADQSDASAAIPVLILDQADLSEEFIEFTATVGAGNPIDTAAIGTYYGKIRVNVTGVGYKYIALYDS